MPLPVIIAIIVFSGIGTLLGLVAMLLCKYDRLTNSKYFDAWAVVFTICIVICGFFSVWAAVSYGNYHSLESVSSPMTIDKSSPDIYGCSVDSVSIDGYTFNLNEMFNRSFPEGSKINVLKYFETSNGICWDQNERDRYKFELIPQ